MCCNYVDQKTFSVILCSFIDVACFHKCHSAGVVSTSGQCLLFSSGLAGCVCSACERERRGVIQDRRQQWPVHRAPEGLLAVLLRSGVQHGREGSWRRRPSPRLLVWSAVHRSSWLVDVSSLTTHSFPTGRCVVCILSHTSLDVQDISRDLGLGVEVHRCWEWKASLKVRSITTERPRLR